MRHQAGKDFVWFWQAAFLKELGSDGMCCRQALGGIIFLVDGQPCLLTGVCKVD